MKGEIFRFCWSAASSRSVKQIKRSKDEWKKLASAKRVGAGGARHPTSKSFVNRSWKTKHTILKISALCSLSMHPVLYSLHIVRLSLSQKINEPQGGGGDAARRLETCGKPPRPLSSRDGLAAPRGYGRWSHQQGPTGRYEKCWICVDRKPLGNLFLKPQERTIFQRI